MNDFHSNTQKDQEQKYQYNVIHTFMNCAGWNPIKLDKYKQYLYIIKTKESN